MSKPLDAVSNGRGKVSVRNAPLDAVATTGAKATVWDKVGAMRPARPKIPGVAFSLRDYMERFDLSYGSAKKELSDLVSQGMLDTAIGSGKGKTGHPERMYWPK
jgi:hypothetical protein